MSAPRVLLAVAPFYRDIADMMIDGARTALTQAGATAEVVEVPGALEIPAAIAWAAESQLYDAFVALGCVIRGETYHFEIVAGESARALMDLTTAFELPIGNGILTVETRDQAVVRADPAQKNKGGEAAEAALALWRLRERWAPDDGA